MTTFTPRRITATASKSGKTYWKIETDLGEASCFDYPIVQELEKSIGKPITLYDLERNEKGFINIRPAKAGSVPFVTQQPTSAPIAIQTDNFVDARKSKDVSIYTSYAKDLFIEMRKGTAKPDSEVMENSIKLIQQARKAFE